MESDAELNEELRRLSKAAEREDTRAGARAGAKAEAGAGTEAEKIVAPSKCNDAWMREKSKKYADLDQSGSWTLFFKKWDHADAAWEKAVMAYRAGELPNVAYIGVMCAGRANATPNETVIFFSCGPFSDKSKCLGIGNMLLSVFDYRKAIYYKPSGEEKDNKAYHYMTANMSMEVIREFKVPFGKYNGLTFVQIQAIDPEYLQWLARKRWFWDKDQLRAFLANQ